MHLPYHFVNLDNEQSTRRRYLLDNYGRFAQLSIFLIPLIYQLVRGVSLIASRWRFFGSGQQGKDRQSPVAARFQEPLRTSSSGLFRRFRWILDDEIVDGWGTVQEWLVVGLWAVWLLFLAFRETGDDYLHLTKRFGIIAASQLPLHYALALKSWSPIQYLTRLSHEELNPYHRLFGRVITIFFSCHASMYLNFYVQKGLLLKRIRDWDVILGVTAISTALLLNTTALAKIRDWNYRVFFYSHVILSLTLLPVLYLHVSHLRVYILETGFVYILLIIQRNVSQSKAKATITQLPSTNLLSITIPLTGSLANKTYTPGQHIYLGLPSLPQKLRINPFSIANPSPAHDGKIQLVARKLKGTTILLADLANDSKKMETTAPIPLLIEGPYGSSTHFPDRETFDRVLFVAGGVGATFTLPLFLDLLQRIGKGERIPPIQFVWTVRRREDAQWGLQMLKEQLGDELPSEVEIYITAPRHDDNSNDENIELQECEHLLSHPNNENVSTPPSISIKHSRPNFHTLINHVFTSTASPDASVAVLVCGPKGMGARLRREVRPWVLRRGRDVFWHGEEFGW